NNIASKIARMRSSKAHPPNSSNRSNRRQQLSKAFLSIRIAVRVNVLPEQLNLRIPEINQLPSFFKNRRRSPAALFAPRIRHHAVGAELVAALDDSDVPAMRIGARRVLGLKAFVGGPIVKPGNPRLTCLQLHQHLRKIAVRSRPADERYVGRALENPFALLLR